MPFEANALTLFDHLLIHVRSIFLTYPRSIRRYEHVGYKRYRIWNYNEAVIND